MKFATIQEAFTHYRTHTVEQIEQRAAEIKGIIETDPNADVTSLNIEISGLQEAKANALEKQKQQTPPAGGQRSQLNPITGMDFAPALSREAASGDIYASPEYRTAFWKHFAGHDMTPTETAVFQRGNDMFRAEHRADAFNTTTNSPAVLPTTTLNEVIKKARTMGGLLSVCRSFNIPSNLSVPVGTPSSRAQWHTEGAKVSGEKADTVAVTFGGYEIIKVFSISAAAKKMSIAAFESYLVDELTACVMECVADGLVNGTGAGQGTGILTINWDATNSATFAASGLKYADVVKIVGMLQRGYAAGAKWAMNNATLYNRFYGLVDGNQRPIFIADPKQENIGKILGFDVVVDDNFADDVILFGNFQYMGYNMPEGIVLEVSRESSFRSGLVDYRALAIADTKPIVPEAFVKLSKASS